MADQMQTLQSGQTVRWNMTHAVKIGPFPFPMRIAVRAYSNHFQGGGQSSAWMKLFYDRDLVGESAGTGDPIPLHVDYVVVLAGDSTASFRLDTGNRISTIQDYGFEISLGAP